MLQEYLGELIADDNTYIAKSVALTFVEMTATTGRVDASATIAGFLESQGALDVPAWRDRLGDATRLIEQAGGIDVAARRTDGARLDDRAALAYMHAALAEAGSG